MNTGLARRNPHTPPQERALGACVVDAKITVYVSRVCTGLQLITIGLFAELP